MAIVKLAVKDVADVVNQATKQISGIEAVLTEDLSNVVDVGVALENANAYETYVYNLMAVVGRSEFMAKAYKTKAPKILRDTFEYGQITQRIRAKLDEASTNQSFGLMDGASYDDNIFVGTDVEVELFKETDAFEIRKSITNDQIKGAFKNAQELGNFVSLVFTMVRNSIRVKLDSLIMMTINHFTATVLQAECQGVYTGRSGVKCVNLLYLYNQIFGTQLTTAKALYDTEFLKFATGTIKKYMGKLENYSTLFNVKGWNDFSDKSDQHLILLEEFSDNCDTYMQSEVWHNEFVKMPYHDTVSMWQGQGTDSSFANTSKINVKTVAGDTVECTGIIGVLMDHDACGVRKDAPSVETKYVRSAQFTNYWFKEHLGYFNDLNSNFIVFYIA